MASSKRWRDVTFYAVATSRQQCRCYKYAIFRNSVTLFFFEKGFGPKRQEEFGFVDISFILSDCHTFFKEMNTFSISK